MATELQCYNKGCSKKYTPEENTATSCKYHPGQPIFHDAYKGWSCCNKKSTDFTQFLNFPGCSSGYHSNEKPPEPVAIKQPVELPEEIIVKAPNPVPAPPSERPPLDEKMTRLKTTVGQTLTQALEKLANQSAKETAMPSSTAVNGAVQPGTPCVNNACGVRYVAPSTSDGPCTHHPGVPVFHEGMKYWSCCQRKTTEFDKFLEQQGCTSGSHVWGQRQDSNVQKPSCRVDWHQTPSFVTISVFAKVCDPVKTTVEANRVATNINVVFDGGKVFEEKVHLNGIIDPARSDVKLLGAKVEINLKKAEPGSWAKLHYAPPPPAGDAEPLAGQQ